MSALLSRLLLLLIRGYQFAISPWLAPSCRFVPSCSEYAVQAVQVHGPWRGSILAARHLARCHPFGGSGLDEIPPSRRIRTRSDDNPAHAEQCENCASKPTGTPTVTGMRADQP